ncbi:hypothetical protein GALMADRAFT_148395 [Galerina marginata CBS 339.88]|uniref:DUF6532 domain-containing protein n=1 Tax=Galerina marginata (strain CBS 339.88) TaxID=685588 RepID=A0A067S4S0_GALM3|nr:hypothetical protein GALMADRAFT_148395 [Galerina marginata CBS 339.88]
MASSGDDETAASKYVVKSITLSEGQSDIEPGMDSTPMALPMFLKGSQGAWNHDCLRDLVMVFLFLKATSPGRAFPQGFKNTVTPVVVALCLTVILCRLHHYREGSSVQLKLSVSAKDYQKYFLYFLVEVSKALENDVNGVLHDTYQMWWQEGLKKFGVTPSSDLSLPRLRGGLADWTPDKAMIPLQTLTNDTTASTSTAGNDPTPPSLDDILAGDTDDYQYDHHPNYYDLNNYNNYNNNDNPQADCKTSSLSTAAIFDLPTHDQSLPPYFF